MPKFHIEVTFGLSTTVEPSGARIEDGSYVEGVEDFDDRSYFGSEDISVTGGEMSFTVTAENEDDAEDKANEVISEGSEVEDDTGYTWLIEDVSIDVERIEEEMTLERAVELLTALFDRLTSGSEVTNEEREAFAFLLRFIATQSATEAEARERGL